ncbi:MAG: aromatase/cyclase [Bacillota bacterium]
MPKVTTKIHVNASPEAAYEIACQMERYPEFFPSVDEVTVTERGEDWTVTSWVARLQGRPVKWTERDEFDEENRIIRYHQISGDLKVFRGQWTFEEEPDGCRVELVVEASLGIPMLGAALDPLVEKLIRDNCNSMLRGLKEEAERQAAG